MTEKTKLIGDCPERVAHDLMREIAAFEGQKRQDSPRLYHLTLYAQCLEVVRGGDPAAALQRP